MEFTGICQPHESAVVVLSKVGQNGPHLCHAPKFESLLLDLLLNFIFLFRSICPFALDHNTLLHWIMSWVMLLVSVTRYSLSRCASITICFDSLCYPLLFRLYLFLICLYYA